MVSSGEEPNNGIDSSVGGLVWVRRRNGSWWPGRILSKDELPDGCVPTPRTGTPVQLLGRDDASVDWYNLERSKRVKAFRCSEYNDCIEKVKASASGLCRKAVKYARKEDAILHALEIESARLGVDHPDFSTRPDPPVEDKQIHNGESPSSPQESRETEDIDEDLSSSDDDSVSAPELAQSGVSFEEPDHINAVKEESKRWRTPNDSEDDGTEGVKRMKGLEDLGMGVDLSSKRKRSISGPVYEFLKKKSRRRTLSKVLECSPKMESVPVASEQQSSPTALESNESKKNNYDSTCENAISLNASKYTTAALLVSKTKENEMSSMVESPDNESSEKLFDVPLVSEEKQPSGLSTVISGPSRKAAALSSQSSHVETISLGNEEHNESGSTNSDTIEVLNINQRIENSTSEWQLKGKRNSRSRKIDVDNEAETFGGTHISDGVKSRPVTEIPPANEFRGWSWNAPQKLNADMAAGPQPQRLLPYRQSRSVINPKYDSADFSLRHHVAPSPGLYDVKVEVKVSHQRRVPYISLMSKLNNKPIIGHPIAIEVLNDGSCDDIMLGVSECNTSSSEFDFDYSQGGKDMLYEQRPRGRPPTKRQSNTTNKRNGPLSKKIRKLSSITGPQRQKKVCKKSVMEKLKGPSIACVPLNIVFSRINAALNSSMRPPARLAEPSSA